IAPAPGLTPKLRQRIIDAATALAGTVRYDNIGTFEFLVDATALGDDAMFAFIEANPRLQVEHTITEEISGVDLVEMQLRLAGGATLADLRIDSAAVLQSPRMAMQLRINMETVAADGS